MTMVIRKSCWESELHTASLRDQLKGILAEALLR